MKEYARAGIAVMLIACSAAVYSFVFYGRCPLEWKDIVNIIVGALVANITAVVQYYFGSSQGSAEKTQLLEKIIKNGTNP